MKFEWVKTLGPLATGPRGNALDRYTSYKLIGSVAPQVHKSETHQYDIFIVYRRYTDDGDDMQFNTMEEAKEYLETQYIAGLI